MKEKFTKTHHEIIDELGTILSHLGANSGIMAIFMSWGDGQDSKSTLEMAKGYNEKYINKKPPHQ
jgi:hypothetical protein